MASGKPLSLAIRSSTRRTRNPYDPRAVKGSILNLVDANFVDCDPTMTLKHALEVIANSTAYGAFVELNEERKSKPVQLDVYSGEHYHRQSARDIEVRGKWYFPALASLITSGGRLLLAMAEKCVTNAGGVWLFADTDSLAVIASPKGGTVYPKRPEEESEMDQREIAPIPVLPHSAVLKIARKRSVIDVLTACGVFCCGR